MATTTVVTGSPCQQDVPLPTFYHIYPLFIPDCPGDHKIPGRGQIEFPASDGNMAFYDGNPFVGGQ